MPSSLPDNHQSPSARPGRGEAENQFYLLMQMTTGKYPVTNRDQDFTQQKNKSPLSQQKRSNYNENKLLFKMDLFWIIFYVEVHYILVWSRELELGEAHSPLSIL